MQLRPRSLLPTLFLFCAVLTAAYLGLPSEAVSQAGTIPDDVTQLTLFFYDDANNNGWRDPAETPFLPPFDTATARVFRLVSATCADDVIGWFVLAAEATNIVETRRNCEYDLISRPFSGDETLPAYIGTVFTAAMELTLYVPSDGVPDNLLGTPTPDPQPATPIPSPTATSLPPNVLTPTPTGTTVTPMPTESASPQPTASPNVMRARVLLPLVPADTPAR